MLYHRVTKFWLKGKLTFFWDKIPKNDKIENLIKIKVFAESWKIFAFVIKKIVSNKTFWCVDKKRAIHETAQELSLELRTNKIYFYDVSLSPSTNTFEIGSSQC